LGVCCAPGRLASARAGELVTCQAIFSEADGATMELAEVPVEVLPDDLGAFGEHL
jgi:hypothetical protein